MSVLRRLLVVTCALALLGAPAALAGTDAPDATASKKGKKCKRGYKLKTVTKHGKKVKVCRKAKGKPKPIPQPGNDTPAAPPAAGLFEAPGTKLEGAAAKPFLQKYLANSTFTDCVPGWPACGGFENRYSHSSDGTFYQCWLRPTSGSDVKSVGEYGFLDARVEPDGSWLYKEQVYWYGHYSLFEWSVSTTGVVNGAQQSDSGGPIESIGPLQYVGGVAKNCSY